MSDQSSKLEKSINNLCQLGGTQEVRAVIDRDLMCQSIGKIVKHAPLTVLAGSSVAQVLKLLKDNRIGCVIIVNDEAKVVGIFSERDFILKIAGEYEEFKESPIDQFMTCDPVVEGPETTVAFALNLMSQGGFRHLPLVDADHHPIGMLSVKDVVDYIVERFVDSMLNFPAQS